MEFGIATKSGTTVVLSTHRHGRGDCGPLNLITPDRVGYLLRIEREHAGMLAATGSRRRRGADDTRVVRR